jgi:tetratricopeptide (TPR) repeat protein
VAAELGTPARAARLAEASTAYQHDRFDDARRLLRPLAERAPSVAAVRELHGLTLYRLGRWRQAIRELEAFHALSGSVDQHPVLADSFRALGRHDEVTRRWDELRRAGAPVEVLVEGRIVAAGDLADQGRLEEAIRLLEAGPVKVRSPRAHHLRLWYALASLYERAGELPRARALLRRVAAADREFADVGARLRALG